MGSGTQVTGYPTHQELGLREVCHAGYNDGVASLVSGYELCFRLTCHRIAIMNPLIFLTKWFWVVWIAVTFINAAAIQSRARPRIIANPELRDGYRTITRGLLTWGNLPWCIMGIGILFGGVPSVFDFFRPRDGNPFVLAFFASVLFVWLLGTHWSHCSLCSPSVPQSPSGFHSEN